MSFLEITQLPACCMLKLDFCHAVNCTWKVKWPNIRTFVQTAYSPYLWVKLEHFLLLFIDLSCLLKGKKSFTPISSLANILCSEYWLIKCRSSITAAIHAVRQIAGLLSSPVTLTAVTWPVQVQYEEWQTEGPSTACADNTGADKCTTYGHKMSPYSHHAFFI